MQIERFITKTIFFSLITFNFLHGADDQKTSNFQRALQAYKDKKRSEIYDKKKEISYEEAKRKISKFFRTTRKGVTLSTRAGLEHLEPLHLLIAQGDPNALEYMTIFFAQGYKTYSSANELAENVLGLFTNPNTNEPAIKLVCSVFKMQNGERFIDNVSQKTIDALKQNTATAFHQARLLNLNYDIGLLIGTPLGGLFTWYTLINFTKSRNSFGLNFITNNPTYSFAYLALTALTAYTAYKCCRTVKANININANKKLDAAFHAEMIFTKAQDFDGLEQTF